jgi:hypothetical protein
VWNTVQLEELVLQTQGPEIFDLWLNMSPHICRCDLVRLFVILEHGGCYCDLDFMCYQNLRSLLDHKSDVLAFVEVEIPFKMAKRMCNGFFAASAGHHFIQTLIDHIVRTFKIRRQRLTSDVMLYTGPDFWYFTHFGLPKHRQPVLLAPETAALISPVGIFRGRNFVTKKYTAEHLPYVCTLWNEGTGWGKFDMFEPHYDEAPTSNPLDPMEVAVVVLAVFFFIALVLLITGWTLYHLEKRRRLNSDPNLPAN